MLLNHSGLAMSLWGLGLLLTSALFAPAHARVEMPAPPAAAMQAGPPAVSLSPAQASYLKTLDVAASVLSQSEDPLAWVWAARLRRDLLLAKSGFDRMAEAQAPSEAEKLRERALQAAPLDAAVLMALVEDCHLLIHSSSAFCQNHGDLVDRWMKADPANGIAWAYKSHGQPLSAQAGMLGQMLQSRGYVSHASEYSRVVLRLHASILSVAKDRGVRPDLLLAMLAQPAWRHVKGPAICDVAMRTRLGMLRPDDAAQPEAIQAQCVALLKRLADDPLDDTWEQLAMMLLVRPWLSGAEAAPYAERLEWHKVRAELDDGLMLLEAGSRFPSAEYMQLLMRRLEDVIKLGTREANRQFFEGKRKMIEQAGR